MAAALGADPEASRSGSESTPTLPSPIKGEGEWGEALAGLRAAEAEIAAFKRAEPRGASSAAQWAFDEAFSDLACAQNRALERLLLVPAPDVAALAVKLALAVEEMAWELPEGEAGMAARGGCGAAGREHRSALPRL